MIFKIFTARRTEIETDDTGTYADGLREENRIDLSARDAGRPRSPHERDYGAGRKVADMPLEFF
jgi:hypothetical protein